MDKSPFFSVVLPTYGRGRYIKPSIESVLAQTFHDFELIVIGDGCTDETEAVARSFDPKRVRWRNLQTNSGSQSFPNNEGIAASRGRWIAYIGHDDIWAPNHLDRLFQKTSSANSTDFVVSGCIFYGPEGSGDYFITGMFETPDDALRHFCPPTSIAHRRDVTERMGGWRDPRIVNCPADNEFLLRAAHAAMRFVSTGEVTVHKFAAGHRYLSYLRPSCDEQQRLLAKLTLPGGFDAGDIVRQSKANRQYMLFQYGDYSSFPNGYLFEQNLKRKGISRPALRPLQGDELIKQTEEPRGLDWHEIQSNGRIFRWSGPNPRPKILIPYTGRRARVSLKVIAKNPAIDLDALSLDIEGSPVRFNVRRRWLGGIADIVADIQLQEADYTVLTLDAPTYQRKNWWRGEDRRKLGVAIGKIRIRALP